MSAPKTTVFSAPEFCLSDLNSTFRIIDRPSELPFGKPSSYQTLMVMSSFAENLKRLMKDRGVSARVICNATGIATSTLSEWTAGREPKLSDQLIKLSRFFGVSLEYLATGKEPSDDVVKEVISSLDDNFIELHQGIYRIRIEKQQGTRKKPSEKNKESK